jgi:hypothetical protein
MSATGYFHGSDVHLFPPVGTMSLHTRLKTVSQCKVTPPVTQLRYRHSIRLCNNGVSWDVMPCGPCKNRRFGGTLSLHHKGDKNWRTCYPDDGGASSSETSVLTRATWRNIPEDCILHSHSRENIKFYIVSKKSHNYCSIGDRRSDS